MFIFETVNYIYEAYVGVPYALYNGRFRMATYPHPSWQDVYDATDYRSRCYQDPTNILELPIPVSEDCLYLYVYVPEGVPCSR